MRQVVGLAPNQLPYRILVVEDRPENRSLLVRLLRAVGFDVREAEHGREAIQIWESWHPHLIWMDMRMPVMDGFEATRYIKSTPQGQQTIIISLTASVFDFEQELIYQAGCDDYVAKPFKEHEIFEKMRIYLGVRYIYDDGDKRSPHQLEQTAEVSPQALQNLPASLLGQLRQAAVRIDVKGIQALIEIVKEHHPDVAEALNTLVRAYRFDKILDVIDKASGGKS
jgi:CheY-like chemotaxis protein